MLLKSYIVASILKSVGFISIFVSPVLCLLAVSVTGSSIEHIKNKRPDLRKIAARNGYVINYSDAETIEAIVTDNPWIIKDLSHQTEKICLLAVMADPYVLKYVRHQTKQICMEAVKRKGTVLRDVREPTIDIQLAAVKQCGYALLDIPNPSEEIRLAAMLQQTTVYHLAKPTEDMWIKVVSVRPHDICYCQHPTPAIRSAAIKADPSMAYYV